MSGTRYIPSKDSGEPVIAREPLRNPDGSYTTLKLVGNHTINPWTKGTTGAGIEISATLSTDAGLDHVKAEMMARQAREVVAEALTRKLGYHVVIDANEDDEIMENAKEASAKMKEAKKS